jgi:hypothetical protein
MINQLTQQPVSNEELENISALAMVQVDLEREIAEIELHLKEKSDKLRELTEIKLPEAMMAVGMESFSLADGTAIKISKFYSASIPKDKSDEAFKWLRDNNYSEIIKRVINCKFGKGEDERANTVALGLTQLNIPFEDKESVHPQTLKAFVREQIEGGVTIPMDLLGVYVGNKSKVTPAK